VDVEVGAIAGYDAGGFLAAMLEGVEAEVGEVGGFGMAEDAEDTTFVVEVIVENGSLHFHFVSNLISKRFLTSRRNNQIRTAIIPTVKIEVNAFQAARKLVIAPNQFKMTIKLTYQPIFLD